MQTIQETFNNVIESGHYDIHEGDKQFMCHALERAYVQGIITYPQKQLAEMAIDNYMDNYGSALISVLNRVLGAGHSFQDCLNIYKDWANRPKLNKE